MSRTRLGVLLLLAAMFSSQPFASDDPVVAVDKGEGRILNCLMAEEDSLSESCAEAMQETEE